MEDISGAASLSFELNTGAKIPAVGLGTSQCPPGVVEEIVKEAIKVGYRHIDCARVYRNEKEIGDALKEMFRRNVVKREDLFITSKLWSADHAPEDVPLALDKTLKDLQLDYIDLYLIHWPMRFKRETTGYGPEVFAPLDIPSTWRAMEKLLSNGKVRAIGVSNFSTKKLQDLISYAKVIPAVNQVECHPLWQQHKLHEFCKSQGIHLSAYSPLGSGGSGWTAVRLLEHPLLKQIAEQLGKTPAHAVLRWGLQSGHSVLPKTINKDRVKSNVEVFDWSIPKETFDQFSQIKQEKLITGEFFVHETLSPYKSVEELWDGEI